MNKSIFPLFLFISILGFGQTYEEKIAYKSCECISNDTETEDINELLKDCIVSSKIDVEHNDPNEKEKRQFTVEGIRKTFRDVSNIVLESCPALRTKISEQKKIAFYKLSENQKANNYFKKGNQFRDENKFLPAIEQYKKAIKKDKEFVFAYDHLAVAYRMTNDFDNAIETYKKSLEIFPEGEFALLNIAAAYSKEKNDLQADRYYKKLIDFYPENPEGYYGSGKTNLILGNNEIALRNILTAIVLYKDQNSKELRDAETILGFVHSRMKEEDQLKKFNQILSEYNVEIGK